MKKNTKETLKIFGIKEVFSLHGFKDRRRVKFFRKKGTVCVECGSDATMTYKKIESSQRVEVGKTDIYEARCYRCWNPLKF